MEYESRVKSFLKLASVSRNNSIVLLINIKDVESEKKLKMCLLTFAFLFAMDNAKFESNSINSFVANKRDRPTSQEKRLPVTWFNV